MKGANDMMAQEFMALVASQYTDKSDDFVLSIGGWSKPEWSVLPIFDADIAVTLREVRDMASTS